MGKNQHVVPDKDGGWNVKGAGNSKSTVHTDTKQEALEKTIEITKNQQSEVVIHGKDGKTQDKDSYGNDQESSKDAKH